MLDIKGSQIKIGDIVKIENSPIKADNATYVVAQDGTSEIYTGTGLTMYKVAKHKEGYSISKSKYNICFYPLVNHSNKYHFNREEMSKATIEIILKAEQNKFDIVKDNDAYEQEETKQTYFHAVIKSGDDEIEDVSYLVSQKEKNDGFFSPI